MTVAIGFQCYDGVLLCADTEISHGQTGKSQESKLHVLSKGSKGHGCACVYAGDVDFMKQVLPSLEGTIRDQEHKQLVNRLNREWLSIHKKSATRWKRGEEFPFIQMLFAIGTGDGPKLYSANLDILRLEKRYEIIGVGADVARSFIEPFYPDTAPLLSMQEAAFLATGALALAKNVVQGCGKKSQFLWFDDISDQFRNFGYGPLDASERKKLEADFVYLQEALGPLVIAFSHIGYTPFDGELKTFTDKFKKYQRLRGKEVARELKEGEQELDQQSREHF
jgi:20S proteasome alpha/beta subunit